MKEKMTCKAIKSAPKGMGRLAKDKKVMTAGKKMKDAKNKQVITMDKQINKVKKDLKKGEKDTNKLLKMDKSFDKKLEKCDLKKSKKK